jgi:hypothetical protein
MFSNHNTDNGLLNARRNLADLLDMHDKMQNMSESDLYEIARTLNNTNAIIHDIINPPTFQIESTKYSISKGTIYGCLKLYENGHYKCYMCLSKGNGTSERIDMIIPITTEIFGWLYEPENGQHTQAQINALNELLEPRISHSYMECDDSVTSTHQTDE